MVGFASRRPTLDGVGELGRVVRMESDEKQKTFFGVTTRYGAARAIALIGYSVVCTVALIAGPFGIVQGIRTESEEAVGAGVMAFLVAPLGYLV